MITTIEFKNRKPSKAVIMRSLGEYLKHGYNNFEILWGENWIDLTFNSTHKHWHGNGWIKDISGDSIAHELNSIRDQAVKQLERQTLNLWNT